jgi:crossover junction endodeoxyribonuclease RuvC
MKVLGIDPGTVTSGYGVVEGAGGKLGFIAAGGITTSAKMSFPERLKRIYDGLDGVLEEHRPDAVALESVFFAKNVQSALKLGHARGVAVLAAVNRGIPVFEYTALQIKQSVVGYGGAEKTQVQKMVKALLNLKELPKPHDASDALAAAICHLNSIKHGAAVASALGRRGRGAR